MDKYIIDFYDHPKKINQTQYKFIEEILDNHKKELIEDKFILLIADSDIHIKLFILFLYYYTSLIKHTKEQHNHIGIDLEFTIGIVALMQINFGKYLWIIDPRKYEKDKLNIIAKKIFINSKIYKILHGADALDIPYIFSGLLDNDKDKILKFMNRFIDSRFLCEYVRTSLGEEGKCSIYDAMLYFGTITKEKYDELMKINEIMGPIQDVMWDINKLSSFHIKYAFYDVLHLIDFLKDIYKMILNKTPQNIRTYYYILEIIRFAILERKGITTVLEYVKNVINPLNNYLIKTKSGNQTLIKIYTDIMNNFIIHEEKGNIDLNFIDKINYVKGTWSFLLKYIVYQLCSKKFKVYKTKTELMTDTIDLEILYKEMEKIKMYKILKLLKLFEIDVNKKLNIL